MDGFLGVPKIDAADLFERIANQLSPTVPGCVAAATTAFGTLPNDANAVSEFAALVGAKDFDHIQAIAEFYALDRRGAQHLNLKFYFRICHSDNIAHDG